MKEELKNFKESVRQVFGVQLKSETLEDAKAELGAMEELLSEKKNARSGKLLKPKTLKEESRSVDVIIATERPVLRYDWQAREFYEEILLVRGCDLESVKDGIPLIDSHKWYSGVKAVFGTTVDLRVEEDKLIGTRIFADTKDANEAFEMIKQGHLKKQSVGYQIKQIVRLKPGEKAEILGKEVTNDCKRTIVYVIKWVPLEDSIVIVPADPDAGVRNEKQILVRETENEAEFNNVSNETQTKGVQKMNKSEDNKTVNVENTVDIEQQLEQARITERERISEIDILCKTHDVSDEMKRQFIDGKGEYSSMDNIRKAVLKELANRSQSQETPAAGKVTVTVEKDNMDSVIPAMRDGLLLTAGLITEKEATAGANDFRNIRTDQFCMEFLARRGEKVSFAISHSNLFQRLMTTADFPLLLSNTAETVAGKAFEKAEETYPIIADSSGSLSSLRPSTIARILGGIDLLEVKEGQDTAYDYFDETGDMVKLLKFARKVAFTEETLINDNLGQFVDALNALGDGVAVLEGNLVYDWLINPPAINGTPFFNAAHGNLASVDAVISETSLGAASTAMITQKDVNGKPIFMKPTFLVVPYQLEQLARKVLFSPQYADDNKAATTVNTVYGALRIVAERRLDAYFASVVAGGGKWPWFVLGPKGKSVKLFYLNGKKKFEISRWVDYDRDAINVRVKHRVAAHGMAYQAFYKNTGL